MSKLQKIQCEICGERDRSTLHAHHIIERVDLGSTEDDSNLCILCANCHSKNHLGNLEIIGIIPSTQLPYGRTVIYKRDGVCNLPGAEEYCIRVKPKSMKVIYG